MPKYPTNSWRAREALMDHESYTTGGAMYASAAVSSFGRLPTEYYESVRDARYVVYSYSTPIAWVLPSGEVVQPPVKYSPTTSGHQGLLYALKLNGPTEDDRRAREAIRVSAQRERQAERDKRANRREQEPRLHPLEARALTASRWFHDSAWMDGYGVSPTLNAHLGGSAALATEDPTASTEDRIAALEAETFAERGPYAEALPTGDIVQRINDALSGL